MSDLKLGSIITTEQHRDATHVAVAPVSSQDKLYPGEHIGLVVGTTDRVCRGGKLVGVVDPFLAQPVMPDEKFWLFLYPQTVTGMRHEWNHPAFPAKPEPSAMSQSEAYIRSLAESIDVTYSKLRSAAEEWVSSGEYLCGGYELEGMSTPGPFWEHYRRVTGKPIPHPENLNFFTCSC